MSRNTILQTLDTSGHPKERQVAATQTLKPGHLVDYNASGDLLKKGDVISSVVVALNNIADQGTPDRVYADGETTSYIYVPRGEECYLRVAAGTAAIALGAILDGQAGGTVITTAAGNKLARALEAVDNSGGGTEVLILVEAL